MEDSLQSSDQDLFLKSVLMLLKKSLFLERVSEMDLNLTLCSNVPNACIVRLVRDIIFNEEFDEQKLKVLSQQIENFVSKLIKEKSIQRRINDVLFVILIHFHCHSLKKDCTLADSTLNEKCEKFCLFHYHFYLEIEKNLDCHCGANLKKLTNSPFYCEKIKKSEVIPLTILQKCQKVARMPFLEYSKPFIQDIIRSSSGILLNILVNQNLLPSFSCGAENCKKSYKFHCSQLNNIRDVYFIELLSENFGLSVTENLLLFLAVPFSLPLKRIYYLEILPEVHLQGIFFTKGSACKYVETEVIKNDLISCIKETIFQGFSASSLVYLKTGKSLMNIENYLPDNLCKLIRLAGQIDWFNSYRNQNCAYIPQYNWKIITKSENDEPKQWVCYCGNKNDSKNHLCIRCSKFRERVEVFKCKNCKKNTSDEEICKQCKSSSYFTAAHLLSREINEKNLEAKVQNICPDCNQVFFQSRFGPKHTCNVILKNSCSKCQKKIDDSHDMCIECRSKDKSNDCFGEIIIQSGKNCILCKNLNKVLFCSKCKNRVYELNQTKCNNYFCQRDLKDNVICQICKVLRVEEFNQIS